MQPRKIEKRENSKMVNRGKTEMQKLANGFFSKPKIPTDT
jgi:hypothetical protein